jgi:hypothetical protein
MPERLARIRQAFAKSYVQPVNGGLIFVKQPHRL